MEILKDLLLVDGYNIIHSWNELKDLLVTLDYEAARTRLIDIMCDYSAQNNIETILVFDAHLKKGSMRHIEKYPPIKVVFTAQHETADQYIERFTIKQDKRLRNIYVATSDALEQTIIFGRGGARLSSRELLLMVNDVKKIQRDTMDEMKNTNNTIASSLNESTIERLDNIIKGIRLEK